jgi:3-oxoacyl-[acyl-carrier-protein] synthase-3
MPEVYLNAIAFAVGDRLEHNTPEVLKQSVEECERLVKKTGVSSRPIALPGQYTSDLALAAADSLFAKQELDRQAIKALLVCTQTPDHLIPGVSSYLHGKLGLSENCFTLDINQGCSGFIMGTQTITALLQSLASPGLLINADTYSRLIRPDDLTTRLLFGDAATASLYSTKPGGLRVIYSRSFADGSGYEAFVAYGSALREDKGKTRGIHMNGAGILNFALSKVPESIHCALEDNGLQIEQLRMIAFHQANSFVIGKLAQKLRLRPDQAPQNCHTLGNAVSASIPLLLREQWPSLKRGDLVMAAGFGVGLSWGVSLFEFVGHEAH